MIVFDWIVIMNPNYKGLIFYMLSGTYSNFSPSLPTQFSFDQPSFCPTTRTRTLDRACNLFLSSSWFLLACVAYVWRKNLNFWSQPIASCNAKGFRIFFSSICFSNRSKVLTLGPAVGWYFVIGSDCWVFLTMMLPWTLYFIFSF